MTRPAVTVRMYYVGFGDCFLVSVPVGDGVWRMLVDCGVHSQGRSEHDIDDIVADVVATAADRTGAPRLDVVVGTHRHRDHVSGFEDDRWQDVQVGQVWLPWVENPEDLAATRLRERHDAAAHALNLALSASDSGMAALALNSLTNERAMWTLRQGFAGNPSRRYVAADLATTTDLAGLPGGSVRFLGPTQDEDALKAMNPPKNQRWFTPDGGSGRDDGGVGRDDDGPAFPAEFTLAGPDHGQRFPHLVVQPALVQRMVHAEDAAFAAATWLDRAVNNTSVIFLLQVGAARLLFPGDAQWGAWRGPLDNPAMRTLLSQVGLYKVSHHGSHNGTPTGLSREVLSTSVTSLLSVRSIPRWAEVPKVELVTELAAPRQVLRSDGPFDAAARRGPDGLWVEIDVPM